MKVQTLTIDGPVTTKAVEGPNWNDIKDAIHQLDGVRYPALGLWLEDEIGMQILGGYDGVFICEILKENENVYLVKPDLSKEDGLCPVKSEGPIYPIYWQCSLAEVERAAFFYAQNGTESPDFSWESE